MANASDYAGLLGSSPGIQYRYDENGNPVPYTTINGQAVPLSSVMTGGIDTGSSQVGGYYGLGAPADVYGANGADVSTWGAPQYTLDANGNVVGSQFQPGMRSQGHLIDVLGALAVGGGALAGAAGAGAGAAGGGMTAAGSDAAVTGMSSGGAMGVDAGMTAAGSDAALGMSSGGTMSGTGGGAVGGGAGGAAGAPITASTPSVVNSAAPTTAGTLANAASLAKPLVGAAAALGASGVGSPQTPATPDYMALLDKQFQQQQALNAQTLQANRFNQVNPYGQSTWTTDANGNVTNTINLSPEQQALLSQNNQSALMSGGLAQNAMRNAGSLGQPIDTSGWFGMKGSIDGTGDAARQQTIASQYGAMTSRLDPQWTQRDAALKQQLANQGIAEGSEAYTNAMRDQSFARNDAYQQAMNSALQLGNQEQNTLFGQNAQNAAFGNQAQNQQYTHALGLQTQQLNAINALRNGSQVTTPQFQASGQAQQIQAPNYMSGAQAAYQGNLNASNAQNAYNNNMMSGLFGLGSAALQKWG